MKTTRRDFLRTSSILSASAAAMTLSTAQLAHGAGTDETIKAVVVGCGGRGRGAVANFLTAPNTQLIACADMHEENAKQAGAGWKLSEDAMFWGFDGFIKALDYGYQNGARYAILATPPGFRPIHYKYAIEKGYNVFMEKPCCVDAPGYRMLMEVNKIADEKGLAVGVGLQRHHDGKYEQGFKEICVNEKYGDLIYAIVCWNSGGARVRNRVENESEMAYQIRNWYYFNWLCGDHICEQHVHNLDIGNWFLGKGDPMFHPVSANSIAGREVRKNSVDFGQIYDHHRVEFTYADGRKMFSQCRHVQGAWGAVYENVRGTKGGGDVTARGGRKGNPFDNEHQDLCKAIREGKPYNEGWYAAHSCMTAIMGRMASYSGQVVKWDDAVNKGPALMIYENHDKLTLDSPAPVQPKFDYNNPEEKEKFLQQAIEELRNGKYELYNIAIPGVTSPFADNNFNKPQ